MLPGDAYREGYNKGRKNDLGSGLAELTMGMLRDDPGGHYAAGYRDGTAGKKFNPPPAEGRKAAAELNPFDDKVAIKTVCPNCGALDWFEWKFLGKLTDPVCGHIWYAGSGAYTLMQIRAIFQAAGRTAKYMTSGIRGEGAWVGKIVGWFCGVVFGFCFRLEAAAFMIPIQAIVGLLQPHKTRTDTTSRAIVLGVFAVGLGIGIYEIQYGARIQSGITQQPGIIQRPVQQATQGAQKEGKTAPLSRPSFDCAKAGTADELLICRDNHLAALDVEMVAAYHQALSRLPPEGRRMLQQEHLDWFRNYSRTCNRASNDDDRAVCVANFLSGRAAQLNSR
jgi:uncharacterized protein YecT (DUF1311 family)